MRTISVFNQVTLDGYFCTKDGDMSWAHADDAHPDSEFQSFIEDNASGDAMLVFGRKTYEMMKSFWPTPAAMKQFPALAKRMNEAPKLVFSKSLTRSDWSNTQIENDLSRMTEIKAGDGPPMVIMGSGTIVAQLTKEKLIDTYQIVTFPIILGSGRTMFDGLDTKLATKLVKTRTFKNGRIFSIYERA